MFIFLANETNVSQKCVMSAFLFPWYSCLIAVMVLLISDVIINDRRHLGDPSLLRFSMQMIITENTVVLKQSLSRGKQETVVILM